MSRDMETGDSQRRLVREETGVGTSCRDPERLMPLGVSAREHSLITLLEQPRRYVGSPDEHRYLEALREIQPDYCDQIGVRSAIALTVFMRDESLVLREAAFDALARIDPELAATFAHAALKDGLGDDGVRDYIQNTLGRFPAPIARHLLHAALAQQGISISGRVVSADRPLPPTLGRGPVAEYLAHVAGQKPDQFERGMRRLLAAAAPEVQFAPIDPFAANRVIAEGQLLCAAIDATNSDGARESAATELFKSGGTDRSAVYAGLLLFSVSPQVQSLAARRLEADEPGLFENLARK